MREGMVISSLSMRADGRIVPPLWQLFELDHRVRHWVLATCELKGSRAATNSSDAPGQDCSLAPAPCRQHTLPNPQGKETLSEKEDTRARLPPSHCPRKIEATAF